MSMASLEEELKRIEDDVSNEFGDNFATDGGTKLSKVHLLILQFTLRNYVDGLVYL